MDELKNAEMRWKESSPQWAAKVAKWEAWVATSKQRERASERSKKTKPQDKEIPTYTKSWDDTFDPDQPLPGFVPKLAKWEHWIAPSKQRQRATERSKKTKQQDNDIPTHNNSWEDSFDPDESLPEFSFAGPWSTYSKTEMEEDIGRLDPAKVKPWAIKALKLGIGVHHAGMNRKYRDLIER